MNSFKITKKPTNLLTTPEFKMEKSLQSICDAAEVYSQQSLCDLVYNAVLVCCALIQRDQQTIIPQLYA